TGSGTLNLTGQFSGRGLTAAVIPGTDAPSSTGDTGRSGDILTQILKTLTASTELTASGVILDNQPPISAEIAATASGGRFQADIRNLIRGDLSLTGRISGDLPISGTPGQTVTAEVNTLRWQETAFQPLNLQWKQSPAGQTVSGTTSGRDLILNLKRSSAPGSPWTGDVILDAFNLGLAGAFLPEPWDTMSGHLTARVELNPAIDAGATRTGDDITIVAAVDELLLGILDRTLRTAGPGRIAYTGTSVSVSQLILTGDDGSRLAANGHWTISSAETTPQHAFSIDLSVPDLSQWTIPEISMSPLKGSLSTSLILAGAWPDIRPAGTVSITGLAVENQRIGNLDLSLSDPPAGGGIAADFEVDDYQPGGGLRIRAGGAATIRNPAGGIQMMDGILHLNRLSARLDSLVYVADAPFDIGLTDGILTITPFRITGPELVLSGDGTLVLADGAEGSLLNVTADIELAPYESLSPDLGDLNGTVRAVLAVKGTAAAPLITGNIAVNRVNWDSPLMPGPVENFSGAIQVTPDAATFSATTLEFAGGRVEITGGLIRGGLGIRSADIRLTARELDLDYASDLQMQGSAELWLRGDWPDITAGGKVLLREVLYTPEVDLIGVLTQLPE
ncbi:MAG TPA: hypothetical protein PLV45_17025, partial [bacterium]|nr:hypothetical protein [bacterium]